jgi:membrane protein DedA with SNARE-associated domain
MNQISPLLASHAESVLFLTIFVEQLGLPIPAAPLLVAAGALAADGLINPALILGITIAACALADLILFEAGRRGNGLLRFFSKLSGEASSARTERFFTRYGLSAIIAAKFIPGLGLLISPMAGGVGMSRGKFLRLDALGSFVYGLFYLGLGVLFKNQIHGVLRWIEQFGVAGLIVAMAFVLVVIAGMYLQRRKASNRPAPQTALGRPYLTT